jgi:hypothetical protein
MNRPHLWERARGFLVSPSKTFDDVAPEKLITALQYFGIWAVIYAILQTVMLFTVDRGVLQTLWDLLGLSGVPLLPFPPAVGVASIVGACVILFISGSWAHLFVRAFGGRKGYENTIEAFAYGNTPVLLFGWIPFVGISFWLCA